MKIVDIAWALCRAVIIAMCLTWPVWAAGPTPDMSHSFLFGTAHEDRAFGAFVLLCLAGAVLLGGLVGIAVLRYHQRRANERMRIYLRDGYILGLRLGGASMESYLRTCPPDQRATLKAECTEAFRARWGSAECSPTIVRQIGETRQ